MPGSYCPNCTQSTVRELASLSKGTHAFYYRCQICGHIWTVPKSDPTADPFTVIQGREMVTTD